ncbi:Fe-S cluster assembly protein SufD [Sodalis endosymbiont of Henestaris halophilus]|uniref:Fe-S cluster assembly protein SufD n=1 Tax=Sodalis endosymbiont of Henestaris halophilus TaxID=1929246 RepID=UPI000BBFE215|nr:Fe-S cluster assembly protein SufD [Sodalis endosymbiont of Henestaris halophilus]SNC58804.1 FeS cluster assembly protein SufD [Sodalis endosymbiont of Henestaris halophilus]
MDGLQNNSNARVITQWHQLFVNQGADCTADAYAHWQNVERLGLPTRQHKDWKYTPLDGLLMHNFVSATASTVSASDLEALSLTMDAYRLVFINGRLAPTLSDSNTGVWQVKLEEGAARRPLPAPILPDVFLHLTESLSQETTRIHLPTNKVAQQPLYLLHISQGCKEKDKLNMLHYRHHLDIGANAQGQVIEHFISVNNKGHFSGAFTSIAVGNNSHFDHVKLAVENSASYHFGHNDISVGRNAIVRSNTFILSTGLTRHQTNVQLNDEGAELEINSLLLPSGQSISDNRTYLEHNKGYCLSRQLHKIIALDRSKGVFNGLIKVAKHALKTDGKMMNHNLLLDLLAEVDTKPQLEIYADDVKCSHGATVGPIDLEQMFYLRSRGITRQDAQQMMIYAFAAEITKKNCHDAVCNTVLKYIADLYRGWRYDLSY